VSRGDATDSSDRETVAGLSRGLRVLEAFNESDAQMTLSEVARRTMMSPAAARRSLRTLAALGYVRSVDRHYLLSARVLSLSSAFLRSADVEGMLTPELRRLAGVFGDTAGIAVLVNTNIIYVAHHCEPRGLRPVAAPGVKYPAYPTSLGRVLLASLIEPELDLYFASARFEKHTNVTETSEKRLRTILRHVRSDGYATIVDQLFYGVTSLAVPIADSAGRTVAALNTSAYTGQMSADMLIRSRLSELRRSAAELARIIGGHPMLRQALRTEPEPKLVPAARRQHAEGAIGENEDPRPAERPKVASRGMAAGSAFVAGDKLSARGLPSRRRFAPPLDEV
jgi:IclR family transcriptional regulator, pca regulon regulatory protein